MEETRVLEDLHRELRAYHNGNGSSVTRCSCWSAA